MLDATSKMPPGILIGTFADFGSYDECLDVQVFHKDGKLDFQGSSCAIELKPPAPPLKRKISLAEIRVANGEDTVKTFIYSMRKLSASKSIRHKFISKIEYLKS